MHFSLSSYIAVQGPGWETVACGGAGDPHTSDPRQAPGAAWAARSPGCVELLTPLQAAETLRSLQAAPTWSAPTVQKEVLMSFLFDNRNNAHSRHLTRKSCKNLDDKNGVTLSTDGLPADWRPVWWCLTQDSQHLQGCKIPCALLPFFVVLVLINSILNANF